MLRRFLQREGQFLLQELGAPDARTLFWRGAFWVYFIVFTSAGIFGVFEIGESFGLPAMFAVIFVLYLL